MEIELVVPLSMIAALNKAVLEAKNLSEVLDLISPYLVVKNIG